jgi:RNA polymerase sigma-70 factor, ECF subfamily
MASMEKDKSLVQRFLAALPRAAPEGSIDLDRLDALLRSTLVGARAAWPKVETQDESFLEYLAQHLDDPAVIEQELAERWCADLLLVHSCLSGDRNGLTAFEHLVREVGNSVLASTNRPDREELLQQQLEKLLIGKPAAKPALLQYRGRGKLRNWLRILLIHAAMKTQRNRQDLASLEDAALHSLRLGSADPEVICLQDDSRRLLKEVLTRSLQDLSTRERTILRYHLLDGLSADQISEIFQVHRTTTFRWLNRIREKLSQATQRNLESSPGTGKQELQSLLRLVRDHLELSFSRILKDEGATPAPKGAAEPAAREGGKDRHDLP